MSASVQQTRTSEVRMDDEGIVRVTILPGAEETLADSKATIAAVMALSGGRRVPIFVDMRRMRAQDRDARQHYGSEEVSRVGTGVALFVESRVSMLIANFFIAVTKTTLPTRMFMHEAEAIAWLKGLPQ